MAVGSAMSENFTHPEIGIGSAPPYMPSVAPPPMGFRSPQRPPLPSSRMPSPPTANTMSAPPRVPGEMLARNELRSRWPSMPSSDETHSSMSVAPYLQTPPTSKVPVGQDGFSVGSEA